MECMFTRKMFETYQAVAGRAIRTMDRIKWLLDVALELPEPREFDGNDVDEYATMQSLLQLINAYN